jgi:alpha-L-fucosidase
MMRSQGAAVVVRSVSLVLSMLAALPASQTLAQTYSVKLQRRLTTVDREVRRGQFRATWDSLGRYRVPEWYRDAKFGIFIHWGVYSVPAFDNEWYSRNMYVQGTAAFEHHVATYGRQSMFGYKDFIPLFTAGKFDPDAWVSFFQRAGAKYIVPVAEHCDGFPMYASDFTAWNASLMGPRRDVVAEIARAARRHGLHFGVSSHRAEHWWWYHDGTKFDSDVNDPKYSALYGPAAPRKLPWDTSGQAPDPNHLECWLPPDKPFLDDWTARSTELVDKYQPELLYFDWWIGQPAFQPYLKRVAAYYYDRAEEWNRGVVLTYKVQAFPENAAVLDIERAKMDLLRLLPWQTDTSVSVKSWGHVKNDTYRTAESLIDELIDVVSKNGNLLLNVGPNSDGTFPEEAQRVLLSMGQWLSMNGEAVYGSRPWIVYGEGPTINSSSRTMGSDRDAYTAHDIRFTSKSGVLYAIALGWPTDRRLTIHALWKGTPYLPRPITHIRLLGSPADIRWSQTSEGLILDLPQEKPNDIAYVFKVSDK